MKKIKDKEFPLMKKQQESLKNMVYQAILNGIFTDEYKPNQIINEQELVQKFGCSKTPIREALVTLLSLIHISEPTRQCCTSRMPSSA